VYILHVCANVGYTVNTQKHRQDINNRSGKGTCRPMTDKNFRHCAYSQLSSRRKFVPPIKYKTMSLGSQMSGQDNSTTSPADELPNLDPRDDVLPYITKAG